jgi:hypothetical protein
MLNFQIDNLHYLDFLSFSFYQFYRGIVHEQFVLCMRLCHC